MKRRLKFLSLLLALNMAAPYSYNLTRFCTGMSLQAYAAETQSVAESTSSPQAQTNKDNEPEQAAPESVSTPEAASESTVTTDETKVVDSTSTSTPAESVPESTAEPTAPDAHSDSTTPSAPDATDGAANNLPTVEPEQNTPAVLANAADSKALEDGINDAWSEENVINGNTTVCAVEDGWLHLKSGTQNGNNPGTNPAMFVNPNTFDFSQAGYFEFTMKTNTEGGSDRFGIYLGYNTDKNGMFVGYDSGGWFWQKYTGGNGDWYSGSRQPAPTKGQEVQVRIEWTADKKMTLKLDGAAVFTDEDFSGIAGTLGNKIAIKAGSYGSAVTDVLLQNIHYTGQKEAVSYAVTGNVVDSEGAAIEGAAVTIGSEKTTTNAQGEFTVQLPNGTYDIKVTKSGYQTATSSVTVKDGAASVADITMQKTVAVETEKLSSEAMDVYVAKNFPSVVRYEMKGDLAGKTFYGQTQAIDTVKINDTEVHVSPDNVKATFTADKATYVMTVKDDANHIDAEITAELVVSGDELAFNITKIDNKLQGETTTNKYGQQVETYPVQTISIPNHSLISVSAAQTGANMKGAVMSSNTHKSGDELIEVNADTQLMANRDYMYAFVSNDELSAGMWSNSEHNGRVVAAPVQGGSQNTRIYASVTEVEGVKTLGLASAEWYYHRNITDSKGVEYTVTETEMPQSKITIAGDRNEDQTIDWQDGAIAFRDIMNNPYKSEEVPELVAWRIAMNFGGQAQNPFLTTLDNVKRVAMNTDGLGQSILLKGYGNEGHDSGHPDYADIGQRMGGAEDMNTLMEKGAEYGARFGVHVNASEMYPEAKAFNEEMVRRNASGGLSYGWNWIDQGIGIDGLYDLAMGMRENRFDELKELVGDNMDFIYVDVWGNLTSSSSEDSWETRKLSKMITDNGWRMTTEWGSGNEYDSTFQHWATDLTYGGYTSKGENSEVMRFLRNHQKDSWVGDYPSYGGVANSPLLGGYNMKDFEGWQGRNDYDAYIVNLYTHNLMTKFLQHYQVVDWEDGAPVQMTDNGETYTWTPEKKITLKADPNKASTETDVVVVERESTDPNTAEYRNRTVTLNGKVISQGAVSRGDNGTGGTESYLIPWVWDSVTGDRVAAEEEKLYHWNTLGGETTWELPSGWENLANVTVYKLTDLGKTEEQKVPVSGGKITLTAEAQTPYIVLKGEEANLDITWSEGMHLTDVGFNSGDAGLEKYWKKDGSGTAQIAKSQYSNPMLKLDGEVSMTQTLTDLVPGQTYSIYVGVDNRSDSKAAMTLSVDGKVVDSNYTERSIAKNYVSAYTHSNSSATVDGTSYFQNMYVYFTAPQSGTVTLTLSKEAGDGSVYFDDIRVVDSKMDVVEKDENGNVIGLHQDFENSVQGLYPFVVGSIEGVSDNRTHLSELHAPYTQAGWDVKKMDDVLTKNDTDSQWSVKVNGLYGRSALVMQTIPQNFRFEPGKKYKVSFDYQAGSDGIYGVVVGNKEYTGSEMVTELPMAMGSNQEQTYSFEVVGAADGQTWFGIYSTSKSPDLQGTSGSVANFGGYQDFVLDNLSIELVEETVTKDDLTALIEEAKANYAQTDYQPEDWALLEQALVNAQVALDKDQQNPDDIATAYYALRAQMEAMNSAPGTEASDRYDIPTTEYAVKVSNEQPDTGYGEGPAAFAQDGDENTHWHTLWGVDSVSDGNAWYQFDFNEPKAITGMRYLPRSGGANANGKLLTAKIEISKDGGKTWEDAPQTTKAAGEFTFDAVTRWQKVDFGQEIEGVTNVRLTALTTTGQSASQKNQFASAAELRVTQYVAPEGTVVDKTGLKAAIDAVGTLNAADYTEATWNVVADKLANAQAVYDNANATAYDVTLAIANLQDAVNALESVPSTKPADKTQLEQAIAEANGLSQSAYTASSWASYQQALAQAKAVFANANATQADVQAALAALNIAKQGLVKIPDKTALQNAVNEASNLNGSAYTAQSWQNYLNALEQAKAVLASNNATEADVKAALDALNAAKNALAAINGGGTGSGSTGSGTGTSTGNGVIVQTGDSSPVAPMLALMATAGAGVAILNPKKKKK